MTVEEHIKKFIGDMAAEIAMLRAQVDTLKGVIHEMENRPAGGTRIDPAGGPGNNDGK
jgi:hypothetical protein